MNKFSEIIGQQDLVAGLQQAMREDGGISHAYLLCGAAGSGRKMIAKTFAGTLLCQDPREENGLLEPCGVCPSCLKVENDDHPDLFVLKPEKETTVGVDDIRALRNEIRKKPYESSRRFFLVPSAERMTVQAQNALLKTLEEPPEYAVTILLADKEDGFLPTVLSRSVVLHTRPLTKEQVLGFLAANAEGRPETAVIDPGLCAELSGGSCGEALRLYTSEEASSLCLESIRLFEEFPDPDIRRIMEFVQESAQNDPPLFLRLLQLWFRDVLVLKRTGDEAALIFKQEIKYINQYSEMLDFTGISGILEDILTAFRRLSVKGNPQYILESVLLSVRDRFRKDKPAETPER